MMNDRYSRQILFRGIGREGQRRIGEAKVVVVGAGALGSVSSEMLTRAGIGRLTIIDRDFVEPSNLQRQSLYTEQDAAEGVPKAVAAARALRAINSDVEVTGVVEDVTADNIRSLCSGHDVIVDGCDNFEIRYLLNDFSVSTGIPWFYGAALGSYGLAMTVLPGQTPCLCCVFPEAPQAGTGETCDTAGIIAPVIHTVAAHQVAQVLRQLVGAPPLLSMFQFDLWTGEMRTLKLPEAVKDCRCCVLRDFVHLRGSAREVPIRLCGRNAVQLTPRVRGTIDLQALGKRLEESGCAVRYGEHLLRFLPSGYEIALFRDGRAIIKGTEDFAEARSLYARYVGG
jgi:molybdopterin-synthase adenylyltransferase